MQAILGVGVFLAVAWAWSEDRRAVPWRNVGLSVAMQVVLALVLLRVPPMRAALKLMSDGVAVVQGAADVGAQFMFGYLAGGPSPFTVVAPQHNFVVAFRILPLILVVSSLSAVLFHLGVLPAIIRAFARLLQRTFRISGVLGFAAASSVFMGIIESPLLVKPYLAKMTRAELFALLVCGMATVAGTVMVLYAQVLGQTMPDALGHVLVASVVSVPASLGLAQLMVPPGAGDDAAGGEGEDEAFVYERQTRTLTEALLQGLSEGVSMVVNIAAVLVLLFALVHLINQGLGLLPSWTDAPLSLELIVGALFQPVVWLAGVPWAETATAARLMAVKTVLNEFVAYQQLAALPADALSPHARLVMTYAMCGFANFGSLGIVVGGLGAVVPERREEIVGLGLRAMLAGTLATLMTGALAGLIA